MTEFYVSGCVHVISEMGRGELLKWENIGFVRGTLRIFKKVSKRGRKIIATNVKHWNENISQNALGIVVELLQWAHSKVRWSSACPLTILLWREERRWWHGRVPVKYGHYFQPLLEFWFCANGFHKCQVRLLVAIMIKIRYSGTHSHAHPRLRLLSRIASVVIADVIIFIAIFAFPTSPVLCQQRKRPWHLFIFFSSARMASGNL